MVETTTERDDEWESQHLCVLMYEEIDMCGCGWGDDAYLLVRDLLDHFHDRDDRNVVEMIGSTGAAQIVLRRLQQADLIDHGTSVVSSWMTDKGRYARHLMHKHGPGDLDMVGMPDCYDYDKDACPDECWVPTADVPPEPPRPTHEELAQRIHDEAEAARAAMSPIQRAIHDETAARMDSYMMFGTPEPPEVVGEPGGLMRDAGIDVQAEADQIRARIAAARRAGTLDLLPRLSPETAAQVAAAAEKTGHMAPRPWPYSMFGDPVQLIPTRGCRQVDGTWIHGRRDGVHTCPRWAR